VGQSKKRDADGVEKEGEDGDAQFLISTTDFFYPLVDTPYLQGRIAAANVLSDLYSLGTERCDTMLMLLGSSTQQDAGPRSAATTLLARGYADACLEGAGVQVTGGQTVMNPWPLIGGVASAVVRTGEFVPVGGIRPGATLVLTKPVGTQIAVNVWQWSKKDELWQKFIESRDLAVDRVVEARAMYETACASMVRLNRAGARLMIPHGAQGATDITGFGIRGHARNLARAQDTPVHIVLDRLPVIAGTRKVGAVHTFFSLDDGFSAETSGGLLVALPSTEAAEAYARAVEEADGTPAWIVGRVLAVPEGGKADAVLADDIEWLEV